MTIQTAKLRKLLTYTSIKRDRLKPWNSALRVSLT